MVERKIVVNNETGLHARPAAQFVQTAATFKSSVVLQTGEKTIDGKSIIQILSAGIGKGSEIIIKASGADEILAVDTLEHLVANFT